MKNAIAVLTAVALLGTATATEVLADEPLKTSSDGRGYAVPVKVNGVDTVKDCVSESPMALDSTLSEVLKWAKVCVFPGTKQAIVVFEQRSGHVGFDKNVSAIRTRLGGSKTEAISEAMK